MQILMLLEQSVEAYHKTNQFMWRVAAQSNNCLADTG